MATTTATKLPTRTLWADLYDSDDDTHDNINCDNCVKPIGDNKRDTCALAIGKIHTLKIDIGEPQKLHSPSQSESDPSTTPSGDYWAISGGNGVWLRIHKRTRRGLETPCNTGNGPGDVGKLTGMRVTCGHFDNGKPFSFTDSWRHKHDAHRELKRPWRGYTAFFEHTCLDTDAYIAKICSVTDVPMASKVQINESANTYVNVTPYSEMYHTHPHFLMAVSDDIKGPRWKALPARSDYFTGKSATVMAARRQALSKSKPRGLRKRRQRILQDANAELERVKALGDTVQEHFLPASFGAAQDHDFSKASSPFSFGGPRPSPFKESSPSHIGGEEFSGSAMEVDSEGLPSGVSDPYPLSAARTKPEHSNKFKKRLGAKKTKLLELADNASHTLSPADATTYRALRARCNDLAQDRPDIPYSSIELCREFAVPNANS